MMFDIFFYEQVTSTMEVAVGLLSSVSPPYGVHALKQTAGYGRQGRNWHSEKGNLYVTLALNPGISVKRWYELSFVSSIAILKMAQAMLGENVSLSVKWPNDVLIEKKKLAGILIEIHSHAPSTIFIGIGVNLCFSPLVTATCLADWGVTCTPQEALKSLLLAFNMVYTLWEKQGFAVIMDIWRANGPIRGSALAFQNRETVYQGTFDYVDNEGFLHLLTDQGRLLLRSGDVLIPPYNPLITP